MAALWDPSRIHRALTPEFLTPIADCLWRVQRAVAKHVQPEAGDNDWVAGCTAYQRRCYALMMVQQQPGFEWLWAGFVDSQFTIRIHGFPIRIYRSPAEGGIPEKYTAGSPMEHALLSLAFEVPGLELPGFLYRIEVLTKRLARPSNISLVELDEFGQIGNTYVIPRSKDVDAPVSKSDSVVRPIRKRKPPVVQPAPEIKPKEEKKRPDDQQEKPA